MTEALIDLAVFSLVSLLITLIVAGLWWLVFPLIVIVIIYLYYEFRE